MRTRGASDSRLPLVVMCLLAALLLMSCASTKKSAVIFVPSQFDIHFDGYQQVQLPPESDIFWLNEATRNYIKQRAELAANSQDKALTLINELFAPSQLALDYVHGANTVAQDTFDSGKANCLSLTILAYAMAKEAGFEVKFYEVFQEESWTQFGEFDLANGHVNLKVTAKVKKQTLQGVPVFKKTYTVDFFPTNRDTKFKTKEIDIQSIVSYFYSNLAAKALLEKDNLSAYAHIRKSLQIYAGDSSTWNNLAVILKRQGLFSKAIDAYQHAIDLRPDNLTAWENMAVLLERTGDIDGARDIRNRLVKQRKENPNYYIRLGNRHLLDDELTEAEAAFKQSLKLDRQNHYAWFGLARVYSLRGDMDQVLTSLEQARHYGRRDGFDARYASKIAALSD